MNFISLREYFYKIANRCYLLVLLPLGIFIFIYYELEKKMINPLIHDETQVQFIVAGMLGFAAFYLTTVHWVSLKRLKKYSQEIGLGHKLDCYYEVVMFRISATCITSLIMGVGLLLTHDPLFGLAFILILGWTFLHWPSARKACRALRLKGDEYEMVLYKKDRL